MSDLFGEDLNGAEIVGKYRRTLWRTVNAAGTGEAAFIGLNPSDADAERNDPTVRRECGFTYRWGCRRYWKLNLHDYRTPSPAVLKRAAVPTWTPENDAAIARVLARTGVRIVVAAWGNDGPWQGRDERVEAIVHAAGHRLVCLALTGAGHPRHTLARGVHRIPDTAEPREWRRPLVTASATGLVGEDVEEV